MRKYFIILIACLIFIISPIYGNSIDTEVIEPYSATMMCSGSSDYSLESGRFTIQFSATKRVDAENWNTRAWISSQSAKEGYFYYVDQNTVYFSPTYDYAEAFVDVQLYGGKVGFQLTTAVLSCKMEYSTLGLENGKEIDDIK